MRHRRDTEQEKQTQRGKCWGGSKSLQKPFQSKPNTERGLLLQLGDVGDGSKSGQINDLAATLQTDLNHNSWCRRRRTSVLCCVLTAVQQEPRDGAQGCTYTGRGGIKGIWLKWMGLMLSKSSGERRKRDLWTVFFTFLCTSRVITGEIQERGFQTLIPLYVCLYWSTILPYMWCIDNVSVNSWLKNQITTTCGAKCWSDLAKWSAPFTHQQCGNFLTVA